MTTIRTVGVIGTGVIGASWTALFLSHGLKVLVSDPAPGAEQKLSDALQSFWPTMQKLGLTDNASLKNYEFVGTSMKGRYAELDFIQENAPERMELKNSLIGEIDAEARPEVVIASSSSGIPSSQFISKAAKHPERIMIGHPFNPPHLMPLVEVVPHPGVDSKSVQTALDFYKSMGKKTIHVKMEVPGHVANRIQAAVCNEAYALVTNGVLSAKDLDVAMTSSLGPRWALIGPLMSNVMGGGGNKDSFHHMLEHLGPASRAWTKDMQEKTFDWSPDSLAKLNQAVLEEYETVDVHKIEHSRDEVLIALLKMKAEATDLQ